MYMCVCARVRAHVCVFLLESLSLSLSKSPFEQPPCHYCKLTIDLGFSFVICHIPKLFINLVTKHG